jgi:hypothetical protein
LGFSSFISFRIFWNRSLATTAELLFDQKPESLLCEMEDQDVKAVQSFEHFEGR